jgi:hypothetical protein
MLLYYKKRVSLGRGVSDPSVSDFMDPRLNSENQIRGFTPKETFVTVLDLGGSHSLRQIRNAVASDDHFRWLSANIPPAGGTLDEWVNVISEQNRLAPAKFFDFGRLCADALGSRAEESLRPVWVTTRSAFCEALQGQTIGRAAGPAPVRSAMEEERIIRGAPPERWTQVVGVPRIQPTWLMVLQYGSADVPLVCRPCVLDAGWYAHHHPTPPEAGVRGHPMDLRHNPLATTLIPEFVHTPIRYSGANLLALRYLPIIVDCDLPAARNAHKGLICRKYGVNW